MKNLYGKCNNPRGHGHNYGLEVTIAGTTDANGQIIARDELDEIVDKEVFARFDHRHLNEDCPEFNGMVPTSENLARVIFDLLDERLQDAEIIVWRRLDCTRRRKIILKWRPLMSRNFEIDFPARRHSQRRRRHHHRFGITRME